MKQGSSILLLGLLGAAGMMRASPIPYTITFSGAVVYPQLDLPYYNPTGSFDYDPAAITNPFSSFLVILANATFDLTSSANAYSGTGCGGTTGAQSVFNYLTSPGAACGDHTWDHVFNTFSAVQMKISPCCNIEYAYPTAILNVFEVGTYTVSAAAPATAPEPGTSTLLFAGVGALWSWNRWRRGSSVEQHIRKQRIGSRSFFRTRQNVPPRATTTE